MIRRSGIEGNKRPGIAAEASARDLVAIEVKHTTIVPVHGQRCGSQPVELRLREAEFAPHGSPPSARSSDAGSRLRSLGYSPFLSTPQPRAKDNRRRIHQQHASQQHRRDGIRQGMFKTSGSSSATSTVFPGLTLRSGRALTEEEAGPVKVGDGRTENSGILRRASPLRLGIVAHSLTGAMRLKHAATSLVQERLTPHC